ncbi:MAG: hypothetical protein IOMNBAOH_01179 [Rhodocyclaceae bacterium]|nr:EAL domain-containing protein [Rhodocyclaceae bacterium]MCG3186620.1 hypothetical protein [Rhodocyclaceae bacterium]
MGERLHVLIVEDCEDDALLLTSHLREAGLDCACHRVDRDEMLAEALANHGWDLVLADYSLPGFDGMQALGRVRAHDPYLPFIFVSGEIGEDVAIAALKEGASDYLMKDNLRRLVPAIRRELRDAELRRAQARAERRLREAEARYRNIVALAADAVVCTDARLRITLFNHSAETVFGYSHAEIVGQPLSRLLPEPVRARHEEQIARFAESGEAIRIAAHRAELVGLRKDGSEFPAEISISRWHDDEGPAYVAIVRDITQRKRDQRILHLIQNVTLAASEAHDVQTALGEGLRTLCESLDWSMAQVWVAKAGTGQLECLGTWCRNEAGLEAFRMASIAAAPGPNEDLPGWVWASGQERWLDELSGARSTRLQLASEAGLRTAVAVPVAAGQQKFAVLELFSRRPRPRDDHLVRILGTAMSQLGVVLQRKLAEARLRHMAHHDYLTELPNRALFAERLRQAMLDATRHQRRVAVALLDLNQFKTVNDTLGHAVGDELLREVGARLRAGVRESDVVARLSGDEFALILQDLARPDDATIVADKVLASFRAPFRLAGRDLHVGASLGMTFFPDDTRDAQLLLRNADIAMYRAKEAGGSCYRFYAEDMSVRLQARLALENDLRRAIEAEEFEPHYQPIVNLRDGRLIGLEALVRWQRPERGLVAPAEFVTLAEQTGLIAALGMQVLRAACRDWRDPPERAPDLRIALNVSPRQLLDAEHMERFETVLAETGFDPARLEIEITETMLMQAGQPVMDAMRRLSERGVRYSIDDFGTGYSSLAYLKRLPISQLKIDRSFIQDLSTDANDAAIVRAIISMAHGLGLSVVAEGVETRAQYEFLRAAGCDAAQGHFLGPPAPPATVRARVRALADASWGAGYEAESSSTRRH